MDTKRLRIPKLKEEGGLPALSEPKGGFSGRRAGWSFIEPRLVDMFYGLSTTAENLIPRGRLSRYHNTRQATLEAMTHCAEYVRYMGMNTLTYVAPYTAGVFKTTVGRLPTGDELLKIVLLVCEKYGIELIYTPLMFRVDPTPMDKELAGLRDPKPHFQVSRSGFSNSPWTSNYYPAYDPLHPARQSFLRDLLNRLLTKFKNYPALKGIQFNIASYTPNEGFVYRSIHWGYSDYDIQLYEKETGVRVPASGDDPQKYQKRYDWLMAKNKEHWIGWRCGKVEQSLRQTIEFMRNIHPDIELYLNISDANDMAYLSWAKREYAKIISKPGGLKKLLKAKGLNIDRVARIPGIVPIYPVEPERLGDGRSGAVISSHIEYQDNDVPEEINYKKNNAFYALRQLYPEKEGYALPAMTTGDVRHGRNFMEPYARRMAEGNVTQFIIGATANPPNIQNELREFIRRYRSLPDVEFRPYSKNELIEPAVMWTAVHKDRSYGYIANPSDIPVKLSFRWKARSPLSRSHPRKSIRGRGEGSYPARKIRSLGPLPSRALDDSAG